MMEITSPNLVLSDLTKKKFTEKNQLLILVFFGGLSIGKTTFHKKLRSCAKEAGINYLNLSNDTVSLWGLEQYRIENPGQYTEEELYAKAIGNIAILFEKELKRIIKQDLKPGKNLLLIDHAKLEHHILEYLSSSKIRVDYKVDLVGVHPKNNGHITIHRNMDESSKKVTNIPFSNQLVLNMVSRTLKRKEHETMVYEDSKKLHVVFSFLLLFEGIQDLNQFYKHKYNWSKIISMDFYTHKDEDLNNSYQLSIVYNQINKCLQTINIFEHPFKSGKNEILKLIRLIEEENKQINKYFSYASENSWNQTINNILTYFSK